MKNCILNIRKYLILVAVFVCTLLLVSCGVDEAGKFELTLEAPKNLTVETNYTTAKKTEYFACFDEVEGADGYYVKISGKVIDTKNTKVDITKYVNAPETLSIGVSAYKDHNGVEEISDSDSYSEKVSRITPSMTYNLLEDGTYEVSCESCTKAEITGTVAFPDYYNGKKVTKMARNCLYRAMDNYEVLGYTESGAAMLSVQVGINHYTTKVVLPKYVTAFGVGAFAGCMKLEGFAIPSAVTEIGSSCFFRCELFKTVTIPEGVTVISSFRNCFALEEVHLPSSVKVIGPQCFENCVNLERINLENIETIYDAAFDNTKFLNGLTDDFVVLCGFLHKYNGESNQIRMEDYPKDLVGIGTRFFQYLDGVEYVYVPFIDEEHALYFGTTGSYMPSGKVSFSDSVKTIVIAEGYTLIMQGALQALPNLESVVIPKSVERIRAIFQRTEKPITIFYSGTEEEWQNVTVEKFTMSFVEKVCFYSEEEPTTVGNFWHYVDGVPTVW